MNEDLNVFELDTNELMIGVLSALEERGYDVREGMPTGVWWLKSDAGTDVALADVASAFTDCLAASMHPVDQ